MRCSKWFRIALAAAWLLASAGCGAGAPARRIGEETYLSGVASSTTGDLDRCALALGNLPDGQIGESGVSGVLVGNVAVVAAAGPGNPTQAALDQIRQSCDRLVQIRLVRDDVNREQLLRIIRAIRRGEPVTEHLEQLYAISQGAEVLAGTADSAAP